MAGLTNCISSLIVRRKRHEPKFGDLHPEFARVVAEAKPRWWLCENVPPRGPEGSPQRAPDVDVPGYKVDRFHLCPTWLGDPQSRKRRFQFGWLDRSTGPILLRRIPFQTFDPLDKHYACTGTARERPVKIGGSGKVKVGSHILTDEERKRRHGGGLSASKKSRAAAGDLAAGQGFPGLNERLGAFTAGATCQAIGNGVPRVMGEAIARAIGEWCDEQEAAA